MSKDEIEESKLEKINEEVQRTIKMFYLHMKVKG